MYSPKVEEELIPKIYQIAKTRGMRMTTLVNKILRKALNGMEGKEDANEDRGSSIRGPGKD